MKMLITWLSILLVLPSCSVQLLPLPEHGTAHFAGLNLSPVAVYKADISIEYYQRFETIEVFANDSFSYCTVFVWSSTVSEQRDTAMKMTEAQLKTLQRFTSMLLHNTITSNTSLESGRSALYTYQGEYDCFRESRNLFSLVKALGLRY